LSYIEVNTVFGTRLCRGTLPLKDKAPPN